ncbi:MAG TPA: rod-binding protein [Caulobacteraceae bacterium]|nr:rod-binding protein [Caulobacteraceae bacterium]
MTSLIAPPVDVLAAPPAASAAELAKRGQIARTARDFEASFLTSMLTTMFKGVSTAPPFGGGAGEKMWTSFFAEAVAKQMVKAGGVGLSHAVEQEMLKLQGLSEPAA